MTNDPAYQSVNLEQLVVNSYHSSDLQNLRKCSGYYMEQDAPDPNKGGVRYHKVEFTNGSFHQFGSAYEEFESGPGNYSTSIVELEDGQVVEAVVSSIKFER